MRRLAAMFLVFFALAISAFAQSRVGEIVRADYGSGSRWTDVTERVRSIAANTPRFRVDDETLGVYSQEQGYKTLRVQVRDRWGTSQQLNFRQNDMADLSNYVSATGTYGDNTGTYGNGRLQITSARYGTGFQTTDVTSLLNSRIQHGRLEMRVGSESLNGDPAPGRNKWLTIHYTYDGRPAQGVYRDGDNVSIPEGTDTYGRQPGYNAGDLQITRARYGSWNKTADVTARLNSRIRDGQLHIQVTNSALGGDPSPGENKTLTVDYTLNGQRRQISAREGETLNLPPGTQPGTYSGNADNYGSQTVTCESRGAARTYCRADTRGGVQLVREFSRSACREGSTWGAEARQIWVSNGCRAEFRVGSSADTSAPPAGASIVIPSGTQLPVRTNEKIDSATATEGQSFSAEMTDDVRDSSGNIAIPKGSDVALVIRSTEGSDLVLDVDSVTVNGQRYAVSTADLQKKGGAGIGANKRTATMMGGGAIAGAIIGAIAGGGKGAAIGAAVGAAGGAGVQVLTRGKQVSVPAETVLTFRLDSDLQLYANPY